MRVLQVITDRDRRGAQVYAMDLAEGLEDLGCVVRTVALAPGTHGDTLKIDVLGPSRRSLRTLRALRRAARDFDVVIAHGSTTLYACGVALVGSRRPFVYRQISDPLFWAPTAAKRVRTGLLLRRARHIVSLSSATADTMAEYYRLARSRITVIPNAVPGDHFRPPSRDERTKARADLGISDDSTLAITVGALVPEKGVDLAIRALAGRQDVRLVIAGDGEQRGELQSLADEAMGSDARFVGAIDDPNSLYWAADLLLMPTRGGDSMPAVLIEAGLCGLPVVTCSVGAIPDIVLDGQTGLVRNPDDLVALRGAIDDLLNDQPYARRLGIAAEAHCRERFTIAATAPRWLALIGS